MHLQNDEHGERYHIIRETFYFSLFAYIISALTTHIGALIDGVVIGQCLGTDSMAAFGLVSPIVIIFSLFGAIVAAGARNRFTMMIGSGDLDGASGVFTLSMIVGIGLSVLLMVIVFAFATPICTLLGATGAAADLMDKARGYLLGIAIGLPAMNAARVLNAYMAIDNDRKLLLIASLTITISDIVLDLVMVFVIHGDTFHMGLATSISHCAELLVYLLHFRRKERLTRFSLRQISLREILPMMGKGLPVGVARVSNVLRCIILNQMMAGMVAASTCIAAYSVQRQADSLLNCFSLGLADTVLMLTGLLVGEQNRPTLRRMLKTSFQAIGIVVLGTAVLLWFLSPWFASSFIKSTSPQALDYATTATRCYAVAMPLHAFNLIFCHYSEGRGKIHTSLAIKFCSEGAFIVLSAFALLPLIGVHAVWTAFPVSQLILGLMVFVIILVQNRRIRVKPKTFWEWYMALPADFDVPPEDRIDMSITSHEQVIELYHAARTFCIEHGCDKRRTYFISLAVEELATNTVQTGFRPGKNNTIDMRILKKGDDYIVRIRDDCAIFDPVKQLKLYDKNVPLHHMGIRIAIESAREVQYTSVLKLNNLMLRV